MSRFNSALGSDLKASVVVFLIALPLGMGVALASGFPPVAGLISGIIGGIVVGSLGGSPFQVSGTAAGLTALVWGGVQLLGFEKLAWAVTIAGLLQVIGGWARLGRWFRMIPPTVLQALLSGIGLLIVTSQVYMLVDQVSPGAGLKALAGFSQLPGALTSTSSQAALCVGSLSILTCVFAPKLPARMRNVLPAPLLAIVLASLVASLLPAPIKMVKIPEGIWAEMSWISLAHWQHALDPQVLLFAVQVALIASAESLLCASAVDLLHTGPRSKYDKELSAQGVGNLLCGMCGVLPITGVIVRSSANINAGAQSRLSTIFHGFWCLAALSIFPALLERIPLAALAGLLVYTGWKLVNPAFFKKLYVNSQLEFFIFLGSVAVIVGYDLLLGVILGCILSAFNLLWQLSRLDLKVNTSTDTDQITVTLEGSATYLRIPQLADSLEALPQGANVEICIQNLRVMDASCSDLIIAWQTRYQNGGGVAHVVANSPETKKIA